MILPGEIVYCRITCKNKKGKTETTKPTIFSIPYNGFDNCLKVTDTLHKRIMDSNGFKENMEITNLDIISRHGFRNKSKEYTEVKQSDEKRNTITGAYE